LRSQHLYKLLHELKYTPTKNTQTHSDLLEEAIEEILKYNIKEVDIKDTLNKYNNRQLDMLR
jgi:hypothetical protein